MTTVAQAADNSERDARIALTRLQQWVEADVARREAFDLTVRTARQHPEFWRWQRTYPSGDSAHDMVVAGWREAALKTSRRGGKVKHEGKFLGDLAGAAQRCMEAEDEALAAVWSVVTSTPGWAKAPQSARDLYRVLHAVAAEPGELGGRRVLMSQRLAIALIESRTRRRYSMGTITKARAWLVNHHAVEAEVGAPWTPGVRSLPTRYDLLPWAEPYAELPHLVRGSELPHVPAPYGVVHFGAWHGVVHSGDSSRPRLSDEDRGVLRRTVRRQQVARLEDAEDRAQRQDV